MRQSIRLLAAGMLLAICGLLAIASLGSRRGPALPPAQVAAPAERDCGACHVEIHAEWKRSAHARSWTNRMVRHLSEEFTNTECVPCHAPQPVLDTGLDKQPAARDDDRASGVGCLVCHRKGGTVAGPTEGVDAPCAPAFAPELTTANACRPCHQLHGLFDEWAKSSYCRDGKRCQDCHMPVVERPIAPDRPARLSHRHDFRAGEDIEMLRSAIDLAVSRQGGEIVVVVRNVGAGHNVPGQMSERAIFCLARVAGDGEEKAYSDTLCLPPRYQRSTVPNTQIEPGKTLTLRYPLQGRSGTARVRVVYKRFRFELDSEARLIKEVAIDY